MADNNKLPQHKSPTQEDRIAHAPYNFVPLPEVVVPAEPLLPQNEYHPDRHTGYINCTLTTLSPLYTRCMMTPAFFVEHGHKAFYDLEPEEQKERARFFNLGEIEKPYIPGSSLRGMVRSLVEIAGYGKVQPVTDRKLIYRVVGDITSFGTRYRDRLMNEDSTNCFTPKIRAGYMKQEGRDWYIQPAQEIDGVTFARVLIDNLPKNLRRWHKSKNADELWVTLGNYEYKEVRHVRIKYTDVQEVNNGFQVGYLKVAHIRTGIMGKKKFDMVVYPENTTAEPILIPDEMIDTYREQISQEQEKLLGENGVLVPEQPIFYLIEDSKLIFFSHTKMLRLPYTNSPNDFVPPSLHSDTQIDLAEAIFGYVRNKKMPKEIAQMRAGRVFFTEAEFHSSTTESIWFSKQPDHIIAPKILSGPKPTSFQHYLVQQTPDWQITGKTKDGKPKQQAILSHYASPTPDETVIRGHKLYWHKSKTVNETDIREPSIAKLREAKKQYTRIQPVNEGVQFSFKVHFEALTDVELGTLLWALELPGGHHHKLGMGKPFGLGSVQIEPKLYLNKPEERYKTLFQGSAWNEGLGNKQPAETKPYKTAFETYVFNSLKTADGTETGNNFRELPRIKTLLYMLYWDKTPSVEDTAYMDLQDDPPNFKERSVLPGPLDIELHLRQQKKIPVPVVPRIGQKFTGEVDRILPNGNIVVKHKDFPIGVVYSSISAKLLFGEYNKGDRIKCQVLNATEDNGYWMLTCKPVYED